MPILLLLGGDQVIALPSVDGAVVPVGPAYIGPPVGGELNLPSVDGASPVVGLSQIYSAVVVSSGTEGSITAGSTTFTAPDGAFSGLSLNDIFTIAGAGPGGSDLVTTVASITDSTTVELADAASTTVGPSEWDIGVSPASLQPKFYFELWTADGSAKLSDLATQTGAQFQEALNDVGSASFTLQLDDPDAALVVPSTEVRCYLFGQVVFSWPILQHPRIRYADPAEGSGRTLAVAGPGRPQLLDRATTYPMGILGSSGTNLDLTVNAQHRIYSFASPDFPNAGTWVPSYEQVKAGTLWQPEGPEGGSRRFVPIEYTGVFEGEEDITQIVEVPAPNGWPVPEAWWIWGQADSTPLGKCFFRKTFSVSSETSVAIIASADNYFTLYLDGSPVLGDDEVLGEWKDYRRIDVNLKTGVHTIGIIGVNAPFNNGVTGLNPAAVLAAVVPLDGDGELVLPPIVQTSSTWKTLAYPDPEPGWTPGQIMIDAIEEAKARGAIPDFEYDFTAENDSLGNSWPFVPGFSVAVGQSLLNMLKALAEEGWVDWRVKPGGKLLQMFNQGAVATETGPTYDITGDIETQEVVSQDFVPQVEIRNRFLVKWTEGYFEIEDAASVAEWGSYEGFIAVDEPTEADARVQAELVLNQTAQPVFAVVLEADPTSESRFPYEAFGVGEKIRVRGPDDVLTWYQVQSIAIGQSDNARPTVALELNARLDERQRAEFELLDQLGKLISGDEVRRNTNMMFNESKTKGFG